MIEFKSNNIPEFVKSFGKDFFEYSLNLDKTSVKDLLFSQTQLTTEQNDTLLDIIEICRHIKLEEIDKKNSDEELHHRIRETILNGTQHILNRWRINCGGIIPQITSSDPIIKLFQKIGIEAYPAFLFKKRKSLFLEGIYIQHQHKTSESLLKLISNDDNLNKLFNIQYNIYTSTGTSASPQLNSFIDLVLFNSFYLMNLEGHCDINSYLRYIEINFNYIKNIATNKEVKTPCYVCYSNLSLPSNTTIDIPQGKISTFNNKIENILPKHHISLNRNNETFSFIHRFEHNYKANFSESNKSQRFPKEYDEFNLIKNNYNDDIILAFHLLATESSNISLNKQWTIVFNPLIRGISFSNVVNNKYPTTPYKITTEEIRLFKYWSEKIFSTDDARIKLAKKKLLESSLRIKPVDSFIDAIIVWENLFGSNAELSFRISSSIACLLEKDESKRKTFYTKLKQTYDTRSKIVHGVKEINYENAKKERDFAFKIGVKCISELYRNYPQLINSDNRSLEILLQLNKPIK